MVARTLSLKDYKRPKEPPPDQTEPLPSISDQMKAEERFRHGNRPLAPEQPYPGRGRK